MIGMLRSKSLSHPTILALLDQVIVSGTRFATTLLIARFCGASELGVYSLAFTVLLLFEHVLQSFVTTPYTVFAHRISNSDRASYGGNCLIQVTILSLSAGLFFAASAVGFSFFASFQPYATVSWSLAAMALFCFVREFIRRFSFAEGNFGTALFFDATTCSVQLILLSSLLGFGKLSASTAYFAIAFACTFASAIWLSRKWRILEDRKCGSLDWRKNWTFGRWVFATQLSNQLGWSVIHWMIAIYSGTLATGIFSGCLTIVYLANPFILGISNQVIPRISQIYADSGLTTSRDYAWRMMLLLFVPMGIFTLIIWAVGEPIAQFLYDSEQFQGVHLTLLFLASGISLLAVTMPAEAILLATEQTRRYTISGILGMLIAIVAAILLLSDGILGASVGLFLGCVVESVCRVIFMVKTGQNAVSLTWPLKTSVHHAKNND